MLLPNLITFKIKFGLRNDWNKPKKSVTLKDIFEKVNLHIENAKRRTFFQF